MCSSLGGAQWKYTRRYAPGSSVIYLLFWITITCLWIHVDGFNGGSLSSTLEMFHASACDGSHVRIQCPPRTLITIQYASYGRSKPSSEMACPSSPAEDTTHRPTFRDLLLGRRRRRRKGRERREDEAGGTREEYDYSLINEDTDCVAVRSFTVMSELCERRPSCAVLASPDTFKEDPCVTTSKYIDVYYKCRPDTFRTDTACEGEEMDIRCGRGDRMVISAAMFGRVPNGSEICPTAKAAYIRCELSDFVDAVRDQCHKRRNCHLEANETDWGKPCSDDISTYLTVTYACLPKKYVKDLNPRGGRRKKKRRKKKRKKKKGRGGGKKHNLTTTTIATTTTSATTTTATTTGTVELVDPNSAISSNDSATTESDDVQVLEGETSTESIQEELTTASDQKDVSTGSRESQTTDHTDLSTEQVESYEPLEEVVTIGHREGRKDSETSSEDPPHLVANLTEEVHTDITTVQDSPERVDSTAGLNPKTTVSPVQAPPTTKKPLAEEDAQETSTEIQEDLDISTEAGRGSGDDLTTASTENDADTTSSSEVDAETTRSGDRDAETTRSGERDAETTMNSGERDAETTASSRDVDELTSLFINGEIKEGGVHDQTTSQGDGHVGAGQDTNEVLPPKRGGESDRETTSQTLPRDADRSDNNEDTNLVRGVKEGREEEEEDEEEEEEPVGANPKEDTNSWDVSTESGLESDSRRNGLNPGQPGKSDNQDPNGAKDTEVKKGEGEVKKKEEGEKSGKDKKPPVLVTERDLKVLCGNYTKTDVRWYEIPRPRDQRSIGFLKDWFSIWHFLATHEEKAWLYFTLGICGGIIILLIIILIKVCINFRRNIKARLDVSEPTHRHTHTTNHHSSLETPMLEHSDSIDRIEVVRFSPRSTLRSVRSNSHNRDIVNYYG